MPKKNSIKPLFFQITLSAQRFQPVLNTGRKNKWGCAIVCLRSGLGVHSPFSRSRWGAPSLGVGGGERRRANLWRATWGQPQTSAQHDTPKEQPNEQPNAPTHNRGRQHSTHTRHTQHTTHAQHTHTPRNSPRTAKRTTTRHSKALVKSGHRHGRTEGSNKRGERVRGTACSDKHSSVKPGVGIKRLEKDKSAPSTQPPPPNPRDPRNSLKTRGQKQTPHRPQQNRETGVYRPVL